MEENNNYGYVVACMHEHVHVCMHAVFVYLHACMQYLCTFSVCICACMACMLISCICLLVACIHKMFHQSEMYSLFYSSKTRPQKMLNITTEQKDLKFAADIDH